MKLQLELSRFCSYCTAAIPFMENGCFNASNYEEFRERLLLEVLPAAYLTIRFYDDYDILRQYALKKLEAQKKE